MTLSSVLLTSKYQPYSHCRPILRVTSGVLTPDTRRIQDDLAIMASECNDNKIERLAASIDEVAQWAMHLDPMKKKLRSMLDDWSNFKQPDGGGKFFQDDCMPPDVASGQGPRNSFGTLKALYSSGALMLKQLEDATSTLEGKLNQVSRVQTPDTRATTN